MTREIPTSSAEAPRRHLLTVGLEDYFQVGALNRWIAREHWYRFETRLEQNVSQTLELLDQYDIKATFFVLGWIADNYPELVRRVAGRGHEIASRGYYHHKATALSASELRDELAQAREALQKASGQAVLGFRLSDGWLGPRDLWVLDLLAEEGYAYDSSLAPRWREFARESWRRFQHKHEHEGKSLWELPIPTARLWRWTLPIGGGNYFRQFPHWMMRKAVRRWHDIYPNPFLMYFHVWELDPEQPKLSSLSPLTKLRHYRNLHKMRGRLESYFRDYAFTSIADYLNLETALPDRSAMEETLPESPVLSVGPGESAPEEPREPVTVVVPCFNEEAVLTYLARALQSLCARLRDMYDLRLIFVNDASTDRTQERLEQLFGSSAHCRIINHETNQGVAAAIRTGIHAAETEVVCSIDSDCTYDPHLLAEMIPRLTPDIDMVTASPYHPDGKVLNVPGWRLFLSKGASFLYRRVLRQKLSTYTSCFRVYRRSAAVRAEVREKRFLGVAELLGQMDLNGSKILEHPAVLTVRLLGRSKMKTVRTILGHSKLLTRLLWKRLRSPSTPPSAGDPSTHERPEEKDTPLSLFCTTSRPEDLPCQ